MLLRIFSQKMTLYIFLAGFVVHFFLFLIRNYPFFNLLLVSFVGGVAFCGIWLAILYGLLVLLGEKEMAYYFQIPLTESELQNIENSYDDPDLDDDLTMDDLYNFSDSSNLASFDDSESPVRMSQALSSENENDDEYTSVRGIDDRSEDALFTDDVDVTPKLDASGEFELTANGKSVKATPKEGAYAIKKVLHDDKKQ